MAGMLEIKWLSFFKSSASNNETVWSPRLFIKDNDGRTDVKSLGNKKISSDDLKKIQDWYLVNSRASVLLFKFEKLRPREIRSLDKVYAACEGVDEIRLNKGTLSLGDASVKGRYKLREKYPEAFKSSTETATARGAR
ncbi:hypothetical protein [Bdellovibrio bacteriovorus]|uniref:hypothetical protein n=1 Tax=Bdellovibrio bacteriovorus TaxID=959 RepID=UPI0035A60712